MVILGGYDKGASTTTPEKVAKHQAKMCLRHGMPIDTTVRTHLPQSIAACRAYVAARLNKPGSAELLLRHFRLAHMSGQYIDEQTLIDQLAQKAGIDAKQLADWMSQPETEKELTAEAEATRSPTQLAATTFRRKISKTSDDRLRYSAPSYQFILNQKIHFELPGFWPLEAYEAAIENLVPTITRAENPNSAKDVLTWADTPLASIEVATILGSDVIKTRPQLEKIADFTPIGHDGFWSLTS